MSTPNIGSNPLTAPVSSTQSSDKPTKTGKSLPADTQVKSLADLPPDVKDAMNMSIAETILKRMRHSIENLKKIRREAERLR